MTALFDVSYLHFHAASIAGNAVDALKNINKDAPSIVEERSRIEAQVDELKSQLPAMRPWLAAVVKFCQNIRDAQAQLPLEKAITSRKTEEVFRLIVLGANCKLKSKDGASLLHLALLEGQTDVVHKLLIEGVDPNEKDKEGKTLLYIAAERGDMRSCYLLLAYKATCGEAEAAMLISLAKIHDPLHISSSDKVLFATALAHLVIQDCAGYPNLAALVDLLGGTWLLLNQLPAINRPSHKAIVVLSLAGLHMLPVTHSVMQLAKTFFAGVSAYTGIKAAYDNFSTQPLASIKKGVVHTVNTLFSWSMFQRSAVYEYKESEFIKSLSQCRNVTVDDISSLDILPSHERMAWVLDNPHALDCPPVLERTFAGWSCQTYKSEFRNASRIHHPDKSANATSSIQTVLNAANSFWKNHCRI